ncbi:MAG: DM13 domain-containing protein [Nodosilinea sp.]
MKKVALSILSLAALGAAIATSVEAIDPVNMNGLLGEQAAVLSTVQLAQAAKPFTTVDQDHATTGTARVVTENGQRYLEFDTAFDTASGPAVKVILHQGATIPVSIAESDYVTIAPLQSFSGAQRYLIPAEINLSDYQTVGIWCQEFNVTFGYAPL